MNAYELILLHAFTNNSSARRNKKKYRLQINPKALINIYEYFNITNRYARIRTARLTARRKNHETFVF